MVMNWGCVIATARNKRKGIDKHHSTVLLVSIICTSLAYMVSHNAWVWIIPAVDIANWQLLWFPVVLIKRRKE
jgi:hypothetical protein